MSRGKRTARAPNFKGIKQPTTPPELTDTGRMSGLIKRYDKHQRASIAPLAMDWIKATYAHAIEYTGSLKACAVRRLQWASPSDWVVVG